MTDSECDILFCAQMRKQRQILKDIASIAFSRRKIDCMRWIEESFLAHRDASRIRRSQSGDAIEQRGLPCSRWPKQNRDAGSDRNVHVKRETAGECLAD